MLEPMGPFPDVVYWRRRAAALAVLVLVALLGVWALSAVTGGEEPGAAPPAAAASSSVRPAPEAPSPATGAATPSTSAPQPEPKPAAKPAPQPTPKPTPEPAPTPQSPKPCPDEVIELTAATDEPEYRVGAEPEFRLMVANTGETACLRDLDAAMQEVLVLGAGGKPRLWSSNDCFTGESDSVRTLLPGELLVFSVVWAGRTSAPGCPRERERVGVGAYQLVAKLGELTSPPAKFRLTS